MKKFFLVIMIFFVSFFTDKNPWAYSPEECITCHKLGGKGSRLNFCIRDFLTSAHGKELTCQDCHVGVLDKEHETSPGSRKVNCSACHDQVNAHGLTSLSEKRPQCYSCHTRHYILKKDNEASSVNPKRLNQTCQQCHPLECGARDFASFFPSLTVASHSKEDFSQRFENDNCLGCHQGQAAHGEQKILNNQKCYLCHLPLKRHAALIGYFHVNPKKQVLSRVAALMYFFAFAVLVWGGFRFLVARFSQAPRI